MVACDCCGSREAVDASWENKIAQCKWFLPQDGINGRNVALDLCRACRTEIGDAVYAILTRHGNAGGR